MNSELIQKIKECTTLPSLPAVAIQVLELAQKQHVDIAEIAHVISKDPAMSSKILRTVNSSFYGRAQSVSTITQALVILGLQSVKTLVLGFSLVSNLSKAKCKGFKHLTYWRRSIYAATAARTLAAKVSIVQQEECFLASLLMDIGMLVLDQVLGDKYGEINEKAPSHNQLAQVEEQMLQLTHAQTAAVFCELWKLPPLLATPISYHDKPDEVTDPALKKLAEVVHLAGRCADVFVDADPNVAIADVRKYAKEHYGIDAEACDEMLSLISTRTKEVAPLFEIQIASSSNFEAILKKANETLVELTLRSQQQAVTLQEQNQVLQKKSITDGLTGLCNRAYLDEYLNEQFAHAKKSGQPLAMLLMDADHFKKVNDQYGHQAGDQVLRALGKLLASAARKQDLAARYGGEEMVLVMPGYNRATAAKVAEAVRRAVAAKPVVFGAQSIPLTISIGVAALEADFPLQTPLQLLKAADLATYAAKNGGRNCVRVFAPRTAPGAKRAQVSAA